jgi:hypothetical protein
VEQWKKEFKLRFIKKADRARENESREDRAKLAKTKELMEDELQKFYHSMRELAADLHESPLD